MRGTAWLTEHSGEEPRGRHRLVRPSSGLLAVSAALLAASAASSTGPAEPVAPAKPAPAPASSASVGAGGNTPPTASFPASFPGSMRASDEIVHAASTGLGLAGIPVTVLDAYRRAAERTNLTQPGCHIPLELLAAIGKVETGHARGGRVTPDGTTLTPILGPVLSGGPFAAIADTDGGALDGDAVWDRAVGPMQFIPGTWSRWRADGNLDGRTDPHNVYDASLAAARYLCAANRDLGTPAGLDASVLSYNHSTSYLSLVRSWLAVYRSGTLAVADILDPARHPGTDPAVAQAAATPPVARPTTPSTPPPAEPTEPVEPPSTPPGTPPSEPPPAEPPGSDPPSEPPATDPPTETPTDPPTEAPAEEPAPSAPGSGLLCEVGNLVGGLLGAPPNPAC